MGVNKMKLEQEFYRTPRFTEQKERVYTVVDLESLSATALYTGKLPKFDGGFGTPPSFTPNAGYFPLTPDGQIGITHHDTGLDKLKYSEGGVKYSVPVIDIIDKL